MSAVRTGVRNGVPVFLRSCCKCALEGVCVDAPWSDFSPLLRNSDGTVKRFKSYCKACTRQIEKTYRDANREAVRTRNNETHRKRMEDPEYADRMRKAWRERMRVWLANPENRARHNEGVRRSRARAAERDPEKYRSDRRIWYGLRREREGRPLNLPPVEAPRVHWQSDRWFRPIGPFREWLETLIRWEYDPSVDDPGSNDHDGLLHVEGRVAALLGITTRQLFRFRFEYPVIEERWIDHCCTREGSTRAEDLYPELRWDWRPAAASGSARDVLSWIARAEREAEEE